MQEIVVPTSWRDRVEELIPKRREVWVVAALVAAAVVGSLLLWMRGAPAAIAPPATSTTAMVTPAPSPSTVLEAPIIYVHVAGAVRKPGLYEFPAGTRVAQAIEAAGGPVRSADLDAVNLAEVLQDGMKLDVPRSGDVVVPPPAATPATGEAVGPVSLNTADQASLETIPGVGPVTAVAIIQHRTEIGSFTALEQLLDVTGIGPATLESIRPYVVL